MHCPVTATKLKGIQEKNFEFSSGFFKPSCYFELKKFYYLKVLQKQLHQQIIV